jgi:class 3 adenylate cyclase
MSRTDTVGDRLTEGRDALRRYAWLEAFELLTSPEVADRLTPEDLEGLGEACWWVARIDDAINARERAFSGYLAGRKGRRAAMVAIAVAKDYFAKKASSTGMAWIKRAEKLLADQQDGIEHGWMLRTRSVLAQEATGDYDSALRYATEALEVGTRFQDADLMAVALLDQGRALVAKGDVDEGLARMEEATVAAVSGELSPFNTGVVYCNIISSCEELADYRRAGEWSEAAKRWCERQAIAGFPGMCRVYRAGILRLRGHLSQAEQEARKACEELRDFNISYAAEAFYEIGEIRLRVGDLGAAGEAFEQAHQLGREPQPGLALLRLEEGNIEGAQSCIKLAIEEEARPLHRARLLRAHVEIALAAGDVATAERAADELGEIAASYHSTAIAADASVAQGRVALERKDVDQVVTLLRKAYRSWQEIDAPFEVAVARSVLGDSHAVAGDHDTARLEWRAAKSLFDRLGARLHSARLAERLGEDAAAVPTADQTTKTFMFTDIANSTTLVEAVGDDAWNDLSRWHDDALRALFSVHEGEEIDHAGDGFFVVFRKDSAALACAVAIQRKLAEHRRLHGFAPRVRIGLHTTVASQVARGYKGRGVHEAARIAGLAAGGEIKASLRTIENASGRFLASEPERVSLKGISEPVDVVSVEWR